MAQSGTFNCFLGSKDALVGRPSSTANHSTAQLLSVKKLIEAGRRCAV